MLKQHRVAALGGVEKVHPKQPLEHDQLEGEADQLRGGKLDEGRCQRRPNKNGHLEQAHPFGPHPEYGHDDVDAAGDRTETNQVDTQEKGLKTHLLKTGAQRRIGRPSGIDPSEEQG